MELKVKYDGYEETAKTFSIEEFVARLNAEEIDNRRDVISVVGISEDRIKEAEQCLINNGIEEDEAYTVLQALGYILLDTELYGED